MTDKIRFSEYVRQQIEKGNFYVAEAYCWHTGGYIYSDEFSIYFSKKNFWTKNVVRLSRRTSSYESIYINLTDDEQKMLWNMQPIAVEIYKEEQRKRNEKRKKELEALEWWP